MDSSINDKLKEKACKKAYELAKDTGADFCSFGEWVTSLVLDEFAREAPAGADKHTVTLQFEVSGVAGPGEPVPCDESLELRLYSLQQDAAGGECIEITIRGKSVTIC
jgi:hypothetical protein